MSAPSNTVTSATPNVGVREDLTNIIHRVAPEKTPMISNIGSNTATNTYHSWQTETLATPDATNAQLEGDDVSSLDAPNLTTRPGNFCQIFRKTGGVSRTQEIVKKAGRASEMARQKTLKGIEARRDAEKRFTGNYASNDESGATPRHSAGILAFLTSNVSRGTGGSSGGFSSGTVSAATNGTQRNFTEASLKGVLATAFNNGAEPSQIYLGSTLKQEFSGFTGIADLRKGVDTGPVKIVAGADIYSSDFGDLTAVPHPYAFSRDALCLDPAYAKVSMLDGYKTVALAKTGDNERFMLTFEATLEVGNERAHAVVSDLQ